jgi:hypothetical protein
MISSKLAAKERLDRTVPLDKAREGAGYGEAVLTIFRDTNLPSRWYHCFLAGQRCRRGSVYRTTPCTVHRARLDNRRRVLFMFSRETSSNRG